MKNYNLINNNDLKNNIKRIDYLKNKKLKKIKKLNNKNLNNLKSCSITERRIAFIYVIYNIICATLYFVSIPIFFKSIFKVESLNSTTNFLIVMALIGIGLSVLYIIFDCSFKSRISSSIVSILGHLAFISNKLTLTLIPVILIIIALKLYINDNNKKRLRIIK